MTDLGTKLNRAIGSALEESERIERAKAPRKARLEELRRATPRVIFRQPPSRGFLGNDRPIYDSLRLVDVRFQKTHVRTYHYFGDSKEQKRRIPDTVNVFRSGGSSYGIPPATLGEYVRRPTSAGLRRLEEAEAELARARVAVRSAVQAAFTYGKPVPLSAVRDVTRRHKAAWDGE